MTSRLATLTFALAVVGCASHAPGARAPRPPGADATATDVVTWPVSPAPTDRPAVALVLPATWGDGAIASYFSLRSLYLAPTDRVVTWGSSLATAAWQHPGLGPVGVLDRPALARFVIDRSRDKQRLNWFDAIARVERLDGTAEAPLDLVATLADARARWDAYAASQATALADALEQAAAATPGRPLGAEQALALDLFFPTWAGGHLYVVHGKRLGRGSELTTPGYYGCSKSYPMIPTDGANGPVRPSGPGSEPPPRPAPDPSEGAPVMSCAPYQTPPTTIRRAYQADLAMVLEYDASGRLLSARTYPPHAVPGPAPRATGGR